MQGVLTAHWDEKAWGIFGIHLAFVVPPVAYLIFSLWTYNAGLKILTLLIFVFLCACLIRSYRFLIYLRWIGKKAYGKRFFS